MTEKGYFYSANRFVAAEHGGTHIDAPYHFSKEGNTLDAVPLERLMGPGVVIDVSSQCEHNPDFQIQIEDLKAWEKNHGQATGWQNHTFQDRIRETLAGQDALFGDRRKRTRCGCEIAFPWAASGSRTLACRANVPPKPLAWTRQASTMANPLFLRAMWHSIRKTSLRSRMWPISTNFPSRDLRSLPYR